MTYEFRYEFIYMKNILQSEIEQGSTGPGAGPARNWSESYDEPWHRSRALRSRGFSVQGMTMCPVSC